MGELKNKASAYLDSFEGESALADVASRKRKAEKIAAVLSDEGAFDKPNVTILDIGCSYGHILRHLTPEDGLGIGVDIDHNLGPNSDNIRFVRTDAEKLPFQNDSFDIVVCNHVYEHTDNASQLLSEVRRVLNDGGICYFAGPNKYEPVEPHYGLPFLSWLPRKLANGYMQLFGKGKSYPEKPYSMPQIRRLVSDFDVVDYTTRILRDPERYRATDILPPGSTKLRLALILHKTAPFFFPGFVFVLRRR